MRLYEFEGIKLFKKEGIPVPEFVLVTSPEEAVKKVKEVGLPAVIKAQVMSGGRYLAGGVKTVNDLDEVKRATQQIMHMIIGGLPVQRAMIVPKVESEKEFYIGITVDEYHGYPVAILSQEGGVSINKIAQERPEMLISHPVSINSGFSASDARRMCRQLGLAGKDFIELANILYSLYKVFRNNDCLLAEINPIVRTSEGNFIALDSKVELDDSALFRHADLGLDIKSHISNPLELKGREIGVTYVELDGDIGIIASGAGLGMASIDIVSKKLKPANFLETGGAITADLLYKVMDLVLSKKGIRALFINVYGGINPIHEGAKGVVKYMQEHNVSIPVVAKALGNHQEETWEIFEKQGVFVVKDVSTEKGIDHIARLLGEKE